MKSVKVGLFSLVAAVLIFQIADAQLFRRNVQRERAVNVQRVVQPIGQVVNSGVCVDGSCGVIQRGPVIQSVRYGLPVAPVVPVVQPVIQPSTMKQQPTPAPAAQSKPVSSGVTFGLDDIYSTKATEIPKFVLAQVDEPAEVSEDPFRKTLVRAIADARKKGTINLRDAVKLRVAMMSPAFVERAQELAVTQVAFSGIESEDVPIGDDGAIKVDGINWEGLALFLEKLVPLILALLKAFGV